MSGGAGWSSLVFFNLRYAQSIILMRRKLSRDTEAQQFHKIQKTLIPQNVGVRIRCGAGLRGEAVQDGDHGEGEGGPGALVTLHRPRHLHRPRSEG